MNSRIGPRSTPLSTGLSLIAAVHVQVVVFDGRPERRAHPGSRPFTSAPWSSRIRATIRLLLRTAIRSGRSCWPQPSRCRRLQPPASVRQRCAILAAYSSGVILLGVGTAAAIGKTAPIDADTFRASRCLAGRDELLASALSGCALIAAPELSRSSTAAEWSRARRSQRRLLELDRGRPRGHPRARSTQRGRRPPRGGHNGASPRRTTMLGSTPASSSR